jgi:hypothetical protein
MNKFNARPVIVDGRKFASTKEGNRYSELKLLERAGQIRLLEIQPEFICLVNGDKIGTYRAVFTYFENGARVVEDVKSNPTKTPLYRWKKRHVESQYDIKIREI